MHCNGEDLNRRAARLWKRRNPLWPGAGAGICTERQAAGWSESPYRTQMRPSGPRSKACCNAPASCSVSMCRRGCRSNCGDQYFAPRYGEPNAGTLAAIRLLASRKACCSTRCIRQGLVACSTVSSAVRSPAGVRRYSAYRRCPGAIRLSSMRHCERIPDIPQTEGLKFPVVLRNESSRLELPDFHPT